MSYSAGDIVNYDDFYYVALNNVNSPAVGSFNDSPINNLSDWETYNTFSESGYVKIGNYDASALNRNVNFNVVGVESKSIIVIIHSRLQLGCL